MTEAISSPAGMRWDVFVSHASEDKVSIARPLAQALRAARFQVWLDEAELTLGDSLRSKIDEGLANSRYGLVILSPAFFAKDWPKRELDGLAAREGKVILPVWHGVTRIQVAAYSPQLAGLLAVDSAVGVEKIVAQVVRVLRPGDNQLAELRKQFLTARTVRELRNVLDAVDANGEEHPESVEGRILRDEIRAALRLAQDSTKFLRPQSLRSRLPSRSWRLVAGVIGVVVLAAVLWSQFGSMDRPPRDTGKPVGRALTFLTREHYAPVVMPGHLGDANVDSDAGIDRLTYRTAGPSRFWQGLDDVPVRAARVIYLEPTNCWTLPDCGYDLRGFRWIRWDARSTGGGTVTVEFEAGGIDSMWGGQTSSLRRVAAPYGDTLAHTSLGSETLTAAWQSFEYELDPSRDDSLRRVVSPFGWEVTWAANGLQPSDDGKSPRTPRTFVIEVRNVRYEK